MHTDCVVEKIKLDIPPVSVYDKFKDSPYSFFLDSALPSKKLGQFSFIGIEPFLIFKSKKDRITLNWQGRKESLRGNPFFILKDLFGQFEVKQENFSIPFTGGGVGYFSYDLKDFNEKLPDRAVDDVNIPDCIMCFYDTILAFDHQKEEFYVISTGFPEKGKRRLCRQRARLESLKRKIGKARHCEGPKAPKQSILGIASSVPLALLGVPPRNDDITERHSSQKGDSAHFLKNGGCPLFSNFTKAGYIKAVEKAKEYIKAGDIYQVNLSQRFQTFLNMDAFLLYKTLRVINPAPFASFLNFGDIKIVSASPERFLKKEGSRIETRPIKGTRPRGKTPLEDSRLKKELTGSIKDNAENLMIIDLERNDLGRISEYGSVHVTEFMTCEEYATVFHLVSTIEGTLRKEITAMDCLINCFPGGSITGAPKIRSMEIIEELEPVKRSVYTGGIGYIGFNGNMDTSIVIRTFIIKDKKAYFQVGGGIVYDSDPENEYEETLHKAKALIDAVSHENSISEQQIYSVK